MTHAVQIKVGPGVTDGSVVINGHDISEVVVRVEVLLEAGGERTVRLDLFPDAVDMDLGGVEVYAETVQP